MRKIALGKLDDIAYIIGNIMYVLGILLIWQLM